MITFHNHLHALHQGKMEMFRGQLVPCFEVPGRVDDVLARVRERGLGPMRQASARDPAVLAGIHAPAYLHFLERAWDDWVALDPANATRDALPSVWPNHGLRTDVLPANFAGAFRSTPALRSRPAPGWRRARGPSARWMPHMRLRTAHVPHSR